MGLLPLRVLHPDLPALLKPGDVGLDSGHSPLSWAIRLKTVSDVSHAWLYAGRAKDIPALSDHPPESQWVMSAERKAVTGKWWRKLRGSKEDVHDGVNYYPLDLKNTVYILRPKTPWNAQRAYMLFEDVCWHGRCRGSKYDTWGLFKSFFGQRYGRVDHAAFCSEVVRQCLEWGEVFPFNTLLDIDATAPSHFKDSLALECFWQRGS
jgi:hypothetical protein